MNIRNCEHASGIVANWIGTYASQHGKKALIVGLTTDLPSMVAAYLCTKVGEYTTKSVMQTLPKTICVHMTDDPGSAKVQRLTDFTNSICELKVLPRPTMMVFEEERLLPLSGDVEKHASYEGSLIAAVLAHYADVYDGLVVGTVTATRGLLQRRHRKYGDGAADIFPLLDLHDSEIAQLAQHWMIRPTASIFPPATDSNNVEWAHRENDRHEIIISQEAQPQQHHLWYKYTAPQKQMIAELYSREKRTKHKSLLTRPYCKLRHIKGLFAQ